MKKILFITLILIVNITFAQVEINPSSINADLNLKSQTKGMLLPRINKPADVNSPQEGLFIYNKELKTPAFHDGGSWRMMNSTAASSVNNIDSLTYTIVNGYGNLSTGTNKLESIDLGVTYDGLANSNVVQIVKPRDAKTIEFIKFFYDSRANGSSATNTLVIEIKVYKKGTSTPYFSYKYKNVKILAFNMGNTTGGNSSNESFTIQGKLFGWYDYATSTGIAYDLSSGTPSFISYSSF